jgi:hypothetical protein
MIHGNFLKRLEPAAEDKIYRFEPAPLIIDTEFNALPAAQINYLPDITARHPQPGSADFIVKLENPGSAPVPASHAFVFQPLGVGKFEPLDKRRHEFRGEVLEPQIFFDGNRQARHKANDGRLIYPQITPINAD